MMVPEIKVNTVVTVWRALKYSNIRVAAFRELSIINICLSGFVLSSIKNVYRSDPRRRRRRRVTCPIVD